MEFEVIGFDEGYGYFKICNGEENCFSIPSIYTTLGSNIIDEDDFNDSPFNKNNLKIEFEGEKYAIGNTARLYDRMLLGTRNFDENFFIKTHSKAKLLSAISLLTDEKEIEINRLVTGLNVNDISSYKKEMISTYKDEVFKFKLPQENIKRIVHINNVEVLPQSIGGYFNEILNFEGLPIKDNIPKGYYGVIDIGHKTVDCFVANNDSYIRESIFGLPLGLNEAYTKVQRDFKVKGTIPLNKIEEAHMGNNEFKHRGSYHTLGDKINKIVKGLADSLKNQIMQVWSKYRDDIDVIYLIGGGANDFYPHLKENMPNEIEIRKFSRPQLSNVLGYYKAGKYYSQK